MLAYAMCSARALHKQAQLVEQLRARHPRIPVPMPSRRRRTSRGLTRTPHQQALLHCHAGLPSPREVFKLKAHNRLPPALHRSSNLPGSRARPGQTPTQSSAVSSGGRLHRKLRASDGQSYVAAGSARGQRKLCLSHGSSRFVANTAQSQRPDIDAGHICCLPPLPAVALLSPGSPVSPSFRLRLPPTCFLAEPECTAYRPLERLSGPWRAAAHIPGPPSPNTSASPRLRPRYCVLSVPRELHTRAADTQRLALTCARQPELACVGRAGRGRCGAV